MHRTASNEATLVSHTPNIIDKENVAIAPGQGKAPASILSDEFCEEQAFPHLLLKGKFGFSTPQNMPTSAALYFNQRLLTFNQYFSSMQIILFLSVLCMSRTTYVHQ